MDQFKNPDKKIPPEKLQELEKMSQELDKTSKDLDVKLNQYKADVAAAEGGMTPELEAHYQNQKEEYLEELDTYIEKLEVCQQVAEKQKEEALAQAMTSVEVVLRKMLIAAEKDPSLRQEVDEWVESYKRTFGRENIFEV